MAGHCQSALKLVRKGRWTMDDFEKWLRVVQAPEEQAAKEFLKTQFAETPPVHHA